MSFTISSILRIDDSNLLIVKWIYDPILTKIINHYKEMFLSYYT